MPFKNLTAVSIDDNLGNLILVEEYCKLLKLKTINFSNPVKALAYIKEHDVDILFVDYMMPKLDGIELIRRFRKNNTTTPIIMITAIHDNNHIKIKALESGATDFLSKPLELSEFKARTSNLLMLHLAQINLKDRAKHLQSEVNKATEELKNREHETLALLGKISEYKDKETANHVSRVSHYSKLLARVFGEDETSQDIIFYASSFHDIGKVGIPDNILLKPGKLTDLEFEKMKEHTHIGYKILLNTSSTYLKEGAIIALNHHEKYDGTGYPNQLKGDEIPLYGRIVAITDVFDALTSVRPYKKIWSTDKAFTFLLEQKNKHFDPKLVDLFIAQKEEILTIYKNFKD